MKKVVKSQMNVPAHTEFVTDNKKDKELNELIKKLKKSN